jgi:Peptidase inhibitor family I36
MKLIFKSITGTMAVAAVLALGSPAMASTDSKNAALAFPCSAGYFCLYTANNWTGSELKVNTSQPNLGSFRNTDNSEANGVGPVRLYYSPNYGGAWVCTISGLAITPLSDYTFNNGSGLAGYGQNIANNVASIKVGGSACTNPI